MSDSESENDLVPGNVFTFQNRGTTICANGPSINAKISSFNFGNNAAWNMERSRYAESACDPRSMGYRRPRERSPMSCYSLSGRVPNERFGSSMSVRTMDSNTSMSVRDIAFALQNVTCNNFDYQLLKKAFNKLSKGRVRRKIEQRRNIRMFRKGFRREPGGDSGDQASDSSISDDDGCRSIKSSRNICKENVYSHRTTRADISNFHNTIKESNMFRDCTDNIKQNSFNNNVSSHLQIATENSQCKTQNMPVLLQKDRFKSSNDFSLPSQRFSRPIASMSILENTNGIYPINEENIRQRQPATNHKQPTEQSNHGTDREEEEIFEVTTNIHNRKRNFDGEENIPVSDKKRYKLSSSQHTSLNLNGKCNQKPNNFVFVKPQFPIRKPGIVKISKFNEKPHQNQYNPASKTSKEPIKEKMITKSPHQLEEKIISSSKQVEEKLLNGSGVCTKLVSKSMSQPVQSEQTSVNKLPSSKPQEKECSKLETTDMSMRPSFIKRKLFTQKVDLAEKNSSSDNEQSDLETNIYSKIQKEKNKARKLASQSCLNRDVNGHDNNLLDLIHKVVPADRMNLTIANRSEIKRIQSKSAKADKWDFTSVLTVCNEEELSDTYTDEDIFIESDKQKSSHLQTLQPVKIKTKNSKISTNLEKSKSITNAVNDKTVKSPEKQTNEKNGMKSYVPQCVKSFWDTDVESDIEAIPMTQHEPGKQNITITTAASKTPEKFQRCNMTTHKMPTNEHDHKINVEKPKLNPNKNKLVDKVQINSAASKKISKEDNTMKRINKTAKDSAIVNKENDAVKNTKRRGKDSAIKNTKIIQNIKTANPHLKTKAKKPKTPKDNKNSELNSSHTNNNTVGSNDSVNLNRTLRTRPLKKLNKCCEESKKVDQSFNISNETTIVTRSRSRLDDLSKSNGDDTIQVDKKPAARNKRMACHKEETTLDISDISFTLTSKDKHNSMGGKNIHYKPSEKQPKRSDVSFTLLYDKSSNNTITKKSSRRNEVELLLQINKSDFKSAMRSHSIQRSILESSMVNRSRRNSARLNKSKMY